MNMRTSWFFGLMGMAGGGLLGMLAQGSLGSSGASGSGGRANPSPELRPRARPYLSM